jgi:hypothetical protein
MFVLVRRNERGPRRPCLLGQWIQTDGWVAEAVILGHVLVAPRNARTFRLLSTLHLVGGAGTVVNVANNPSPRIAGDAQTSVAAADVRTGRLETLNRLTVGQWHSLIEAERWDILDWNERRSETGERLLQDHPDIAETLLPGVEVRDLVCERIEVILRKRGGSARHA